MRLQAGSKLWLLRRGNANYQQQLFCRVIELNLDYLIAAVRKTATPEVVAHVNKYGPVIKREYDATVNATAVVDPSPEEAVETTDGVKTKTTIGEANPEVAAPTPSRTSKGSSSTTS